jgi:death-on-curing protein
MSWLWLSKAAVLVFHEMQIAEHGGGTGIRDEGLLESALSRPENLSMYGTPDVFDLAAAYAFGIAKNHPFVDGNKRTAFVAAAVFLELNGYIFQASEVDVVLKVMALASGEMDEKSFSAWLRKNTAKA